MARLWRVTRRFGFLPVRTLLGVFGLLSFLASAATAQTVTDFDLNHKSDVLWRNVTTGQTMIWLMDGTTILDCRTYRNLCRILTRK